MGSVALTVLNLNATHLMTHQVRCIDSTKYQCNAPDECVALRLCTVNATLLTNSLENTSLLNH